jgi:hypothetical protein
LKLFLSCFRASSCCFCTFRKTYGEKKRSRAKLSCHV